ncbi:MAG: hypothetical protein LBL66_03505 [Clostridiales bacterium]|jgi:hypothetical protein|nr:hypothetical protein [Clostridiales bacterium]
MDFRKLKNPPAEYRGMPFWSWNGELEKGELIRQARLLKAMGFGGFFMHSRSGLVTEYLGEEWFGLIAACAEEAEKLGLYAYIYDEDRWPSGSAGGRVTKNPRYRSKYISMRLFGREEFDLGNFGQEYLASFAVLLTEGGDLVDYYPVTDRLDIRDGYKAAVFYVEEMSKDPFYNGYTYLDTLNREATERYIAETHEKYKAAVGEKFGKQIVGIFTDEPHRGCVFGGFSLENENKRNMVPYTYTLPAVFFEANGYGLIEKLPELYYKKNGENFSKVSYDYISTVQKMFLDNFAKPYHDWCTENNLTVTGHILHEDSLTAQTAVSGSVMRYYEYMDYPGVDILTEGNRCYWVVKQVQSVARQLGKPFALSELYGCTGWQFNFESHKNVGDWQAVLGINMRCHHLSWYTMEGVAKRDYPASIFYQSAWYDNYNYVEEYFARMGYALSQGEPTADILVVNPVESVWGYARKGCFKDFTPLNGDVKALEKKYADQFRALTDAGVDFDYGDEDIIARKGGAAGAVLSVGKMRYRAVLISGADTLRASTLKILSQFAADGGTVILCGEKPAYIDGIKTSEKFDFCVRAKDEKDAAELCRKNAAVTLTAVGGAKNFLSAIRKLGEGEYLAVALNADRENAAEAEFAFSESANVYEFDLRRGVEKPCEFERGKNTTSIRARFEKGRERMFVFTQRNVDIKEKETEETGRVRLEGPLPYKLSEPNILVLDTADYYVNGERCGTAEILKIDKAVREKTGLAQRKSHMVQPWYRNKYFSRAARESVCELKLEFRFYAESPPEKLDLVCERPEDFKLYLNGSAVPSEPSGTFIDNSFKVIPLDAGALSVGENVLAMKCGFSDSVGLEAAYLTGNFGVRVEGTKKTVTKLPETLCEKKPMSEQGLPFYSGKIAFGTGVKNVPAAKLVFDEMKCAYVSADFGTESETVAFAPYETDWHGARGEIGFTVCFTRRNTFGPLHVTRPNQAAYGPFSFVTEGDEWTDGYTFYDERVCFPEIKLGKPRDGDKIRKKDKRS